MIYFLNFNNQLRMNIYCSFKVTDDNLIKNLNRFENDISWNQYFLEMLNINLILTEENIISFYNFSKTFESKQNTIEIFKKISFNLILF